MNSFVVNFQMSIYSSLQYTAYNTLFHYLQVPNTFVLIGLMFNDVNDASNFNSAVHFIIEDKDVDKIITNVINKTSFKQNSNYNNNYNIFNKNDEQLQQDNSFVSQEMKSMINYKQK